MVTAYYIMNMSSKSHKSWDINDHHFIEEVTSSTKKNICRICLRSGKIKIFEEETNIRDALMTFGDIQIRENDILPKHLCDTCYSFIKVAILFRKTAKKTEEKLKQVREVEEYGEDNTDDINSADHDTNYLNCTNWDEDNMPLETLVKKQKSRSVCKICNKVVFSSYYKEHMLVHETCPSYVCEVCGKSFKLRCSYLNHKNRHHSGFPYKCKLCPYRGKYIELFKSHMRTHAGEYRYMCTQCPARFLFKSNLNSHLRKHKEPKFKCDSCSCNRRFHSKLMLKRHFEADHLGIKNHICSICGKAFGYRNAMMKHQRNVHKREKCEFRRRPAYLAADQDPADNN